MARVGETDKAFFSYFAGQACKTEVQILPVYGSQERLSRARFPWVCVRQRSMALAPLLLYDGRCGFCAAGVGSYSGMASTAPCASLGCRVRSDRKSGADINTLEGVDSMGWVDPAAEGHAERVLINRRRLCGRQLPGWGLAVSSLG